MNSRRIITIAGATALITSVSYYAFAQDEIDALRYSYLSPQGTARSIGFGNALGSVGGDFSSLSVNPAGIGVYRSSEIMITPSLKINSNNSTYLSARSSADATKFNISNIGAVFTKTPRGRRYKNSDWKSFSFGIGLNRMADFTRDYTYHGLNSGAGSSSASEVFAVDANNNASNVSTEGTPAYLGYKSYLIDYDTVGNFYKTNVPWHQGINQQRTVKERGGMSELLFSFGGNYQEKLLLGLTIGIPNIHYTRDASYTESDAANYSTIFQSFTLSEYLTTDGLGINAKLGFIYKPSDQFRFGAAIHTPTAFAMTDEYDQSLIANTEGYATGGDKRIDAPHNQFDYTLVTPWRAVASATAMLGNIGFITADYEYVDYKSTHYNFSTNDINYKASYQEYETQINQAIKSSYKSASNIRAGVEIRLQPIMLRAGFGYYGNPYQNYANGERYDFSGGLGFRFQKVFIDLGFTHSDYKNKEQPYTLPTTGAYQGVVVPSALLKNTVNNIALTIGFKF